MINLEILLRVDSKGRGLHSYSFIIIWKTDDALKPLALVIERKSTFDTHF